MPRAKTHYHHYRPKGVKKKSFEKVYWPYIALIAVWFSLLLAPVSAHVASPLHKKHVLAYATSMSINGLLTSTNDARAANGVAGLSINSKLNAAAQSKANDMATRDYWSHNTPDGNPPWIFVDAQGYAYQKIGENLATGFSDEQATINGWMNSPGHRANMLDTAFKEVGFGFANIANYTAVGGGPMTIIVAFYGVTATSPAPPAPVVNVSTCPTGTTGTPPNCVKPAPVVAKPTPAPAPAPAATPTPAPTPAAADQPTKQIEDSVVPAGTTKPTTKKSAVQPTTNLTTPTEDTTKASRIDVLSSNPTATTFASGALSFGLVLLAIAWSAKHIYSLRRSIVKGEQFVISHPYIDLALIAVIAAIVALSGTAGFIK